MAWCQAAEGRSDVAYKDDKRDLVVCPLPYDGSFVETFRTARRVVTAFLGADTQMPKEAALSRPADRTVARSLVDRRQFAVIEVYDALAGIAQPHLLQMQTTDAGLIIAGGTAVPIDTIGILAPSPLTPDPPSILVLPHRAVMDSRRAADGSDGA